MSWKVKLRNNETNAIFDVISYKDKYQEAIDATLKVYPNHTNISAIWEAPKSYTAPVEKKIRSFDVKKRVLQ